MRFDRTFFFLFVFAAVAVWAEEDEEETETEEQTEKPLDFSHGFGTDIEWVEWSKAFELSKEQKKPVFLLVHKTWCGACKQLKNSFKTSPKRKEFVDLSRKFVMVNLEDEEEPEDDKYAPDGRYIPRLYFVDENEELLPIDNKKNYPRNAYYFPQLVDVIKAMKQAIKIQTAKDSPDEEVEAKSSDEKPKKKKAEEKKPKEEETEDKENEKPKKTEKKAEKKTEKPKEKEAKKKSEEKKAKSDDDKAECPHAAKAKAEKEKKEKSEGKKEKSKKDAGKKETEKKKTDKKADEKKKSDKKDAKDAKKDEKSKKTKKAADKKTEL